MENDQLAQVEGNRLYIAFYYVTLFAIFYEISFFDFENIHLLKYVLVQLGRVTSIPPSVQIPHTSWTQPASINARLATCRMR